MENFFIDFIYKFKEFVQIMLDTRKLPKRKDKIDFFKNSKYTIGITIIGLILNALIILIAEFIIGLIVFFFIGFIIRYIPFDAIKPKGLHNVVTYIAECFDIVPGTYDLENASDFQMHFGIIWILLGSLFTFRSMLIYNFTFKTGQFDDQPYSPTFLGTIFRVFFRGAKFAFVILTWPIFLFIKLPSKDDIYNTPKYTH